MTVPMYHGVDILSLKQEGPMNVIYIWGSLRWRHLCLES